MSPVHPAPLYLPSPTLRSALGPAQMPLTQRLPGQALSSQALDLYPAEGSAAHQRLLLLLGVGECRASPSSLFPNACPTATWARAAPTKVEAFVLVLGVEEDSLGVGIDVGPGGDEHSRDVSLAPLDGDVESRLPCGPGGMCRGFTWVLRPP